MSQSVYVIECKVDGRLYVGRTSHPNQRWLCHKNYARSGRGFRVHDAIRALGEENFEFRIIAKCASDEEAMRLEADLILRLGTTSPDRGFNITGGGDDILEVVRISAATRKKRMQEDPEAESRWISEIRKRAFRNLPSSERQKISDASRRRMLLMREEMGEQRCREINKMAHEALAKLSPEQRRAKAKKANETLGPEGRKARARKAVEAQTFEQLSARAKKTVAAQTPEQRSEARRKSWITRRAKAMAAGNKRLS